MQGRAYKWTDDMHVFCKANTDLTRPELTKLFNDTFVLNRPITALQGFCKRNGYITGRSGCFVVGSTPHNKGVKGFSPKGSELGRFKKGQTPTTTLPVGSETKLEKVGESHYWRVKVGHPNKWKLKHHVIWENANGPIPKGSIVIFIDSDTDNITIENLACVTRGELAILNATYNWKSTPKEGRATVLLLAKLQHRTVKTEQQLTEKQK